MCGPYHQVVHPDYDYWLIRNKIHVWKIGQDVFIWRNRAKTRHYVRHYHIGDEHCPKSSIQKRQQSPQAVASWLRIAKEELPFLTCYHWVQTIKFSEQRSVAACQGPAGALMENPEQFLLVHAALELI